MDAVAGKSSGVFSAASKLIEGLLSSAQNRVQLLSIEFQEEKLRLVQLFIWVAATVFAGMMTIGFASITVVFLFWENARLLALAGATVFYAAGFGVLCWQFKRYISRQPKPFEATLGELTRDRACIRPTS